MVEVRFLETSGAPETNREITARLLAQVAPLHVEWKRALPPVLGQVGQGAIFREVESVARELGAFEKMIVVGIGGSSLGVRAVLSALPLPASPCKGEGRQIIVCDALDPDGVASVLQETDWKKTVLTIISKSGGTLEIMAIASVLVDALKKSVGKDWARHVVAVTDPDSGFLRQWATENKIRSCAIPPDVGGRFSVFTAAGLLPLQWAGYNVAELLSGAQSALAKTLAAPPDTALPLQLAVQHVAWDQAGRPITVIMPYATALADYARWFAQLWAESLGKEGRGQTPMIAVGSADQHSQLQMFAEGPPNKFIRFITVENWDHDLKISQPIDPSATHLKGQSLGHLLKTAADSTAAALAEVGCPSYTLQLPALDAKSLGALMMSDIMTTLAAATLYGVDPYGQPGVERGKKLWRERLLP